MIKHPRKFRLSHFIALILRSRGPIQYFTSSLMSCYVFYILYNGVKRLSYKKKKNTLALSLL